MQFLKLTKGLKKYLTVTCFIVVCYFSSCENEIEQKTSFISEYYQNGNVRYMGKTIDGRLQGAHKWFFPNGKIEMITNYKDNLEHGPQYIFYSKPNKIRVINYFKNGVLSDSSFFYSEEGSLETIHIHDDNGMIVNIINSKNNRSSKSK